MGTPNFARPSNASKYFVVLTGREEKYIECPECENKHYEWGHTLEELKECDLCEEDLSNEDIQEEYKMPEEWDANDLIGNLGYAIKEIGGTKENETLDYGQYGIQSVGYLSQDKSYGDYNLTVRVTAVIQSAYYEGATLDWLVTLETDFETFKIGDNQWSEDTLEDAIEYTISPNNGDMNEGMCKIQRRNAEKWADQAITDLSEKIEAIFEIYQEHKLECQGVFSNGEAVYREVV